MKNKALALLICIPFLASCEAYLSGDNSQGQLGIAGAGDPIAGTAGWLGTSHKWVKLVAGEAMTCAIDTETELWCWGDNSRGQMGNGATGGNQETPSQVGSTTGWEQVAPGFRHVCGIRSGELWCWGTDSYGELGTGGSSTAVKNTPQRVGSASNWIQVTSGVRHSCGIRGSMSDGDLYCWGYNNKGQIGNGTAINVHAPAYVGPGYSSVDAGYEHTCGVRFSNIYCWGSNEFGQLGSENIAWPSSRYLPNHAVTKPSGIFGWKSVSAGRDATCAIGRESVFGGGVQEFLHCWGNNGTFLFPPYDAIFREPVEYGRTCWSHIFSTDCFNWRTRITYSDVAVGGEHICAVKSSDLTRYPPSGPFTGPVIEEAAANDLLCRGSNSTGQLNIQNVVASLSSTQTIVSVSAGSFFSSVLIHDAD